MKEEWYLVPFYLDLLPAISKRRSLCTAPFRPFLVFSESSTSEHPPPSPDSPHASNRPTAPPSGAPLGPKPRG